jgi:hypothetical protein
VDGRVSRLCSVLTQAWLDAADRAGHDVFTGVVIGVASFVAVGTLTTRWDGATLVALIAFFAYFLVVLGYCIVRDAPGFNMRWEPSASWNVHDIRFQIESRGNQIWSLNGLACEVVGPEKTKALVVEKQRQFLPKVYFDYPTNFRSGAAPAKAVPGRYSAVWFEKTRRGKWREILRYHAEL